MNIPKKIGAQGDCLFIRRRSLPHEIRERVRNGPIVVAHSETGHNHEIADPAVRVFDRIENDPLVCFLSVDGEHADVMHHRAWDTHAPIRLLKGIWEVRRQREHTPEGWRRVED